MGIHLIYQRLLSRFTKRFQRHQDQPQHWDFTIADQHISTNALKVLAGLQEAGFTAYLVGGGVRDLLAGKKPKDFDVATNAAPEQIRKVFHNSRIIGRRFRLVHVFYRREIIEVSTFRAHVDEPILDVGVRAANNIFGTIEEDAWRRDFTINALYYDAKNRKVVDYTGGMQDLQSKLIRIIGDPAQRFHEDPVRLLRAIRLSAKLQFDVHSDTEMLLRELSGSLQHVAKARLFDEVLKFFFTGHAWATYQKLCHYNYLSALFPQTWLVLNSATRSHYHTIIELAMQETDHRYEHSNSLNPGFLFAILLWPAIQNKLQENSGKKFHALLRCTIDKVLKEQTQVLVIPNRLTKMMSSIWLLQYYLTQPRKSRVYRTLFHRYFRAAFDFLELRVRSGEAYQQTLEWWREFRQADSEKRKEMLNQLPTKEA